MNVTRDREKEYSSKKKKKKKTIGTHDCFLWRNEPFAYSFITNFSLTFSYALIPIYNV